MEFEREKTGIEDMASSKMILKLYRNIGSSEIDCFLRGVEVEAEEDVSELADATL